MTSVLMLFSMLSDKFLLMLVILWLEGANSGFDLCFPGPECPYGVVVCSFVPRTEFHDFGMRAERIGEEVATTPKVRSTSVQS